MTQDGMPASAAPHPSWCDPSICTIAEDRPYGCHQSASQVVAADPPIDVVAELHLVSTMPAVLPLTLRQTRQLHAALDNLLASAAA